LVCIDGGEKKEDTHTGMTCTPFELHAEGLPDTERKVFDGKQTTEDISMQEFPSGIEVELESDKDQAASAGSETQLARRLTYMTPVEHLIGDSPNQCIIEVAELLDKKDGLDCVQLWQELLHKSPNEEAVHQQTEGPTMFLLKLWCQIKRSAATVGELIRALDAVNRPDISMLLQTYCQSTEVASAVEINSYQWRMEPVGDRVIELRLGTQKRVQLLQTSCERYVVGQEGYLMGSLTSKWIFCIPPGALDYEQDITVSFYHVIDSVDLDSNEFVTGLIEILPHDLKFSKPVELLLRHHMCIEDDSSEVKVLYESGETHTKTLTSLCQLGSVDEIAYYTDMKISLWHDFVHIKTPHLCRFLMECKGKRFIVVQASLRYHECPDEKHLFVRLSLGSTVPVADEEGAEPRKTWNHCQIKLRCDDEESLHINVGILPKGSGWKVMDDHIFQKTITYNDIKHMVIHGSEIITNDFLFSKGESGVSLADVFPVFVFNNNYRCILLRTALPPIPQELSVNSAAMSNGERSGAAGTSTVAKEDTQHQPPGPDMTLSPPEGVQATNGVHMEPVDCYNGKGESQLNSDDLNRLVEERDICILITQFAYVAQRWLEIGWLMMKSSGLTMADIRNSVKELFPNASDTVNVIHLIEQWQSLKKEEATARALVDIFCDPVVGGVRHIIENALMSDSNNHGASSNVVCGNHSHSATSSELELNTLINEMKVAPDQWRPIGFEMGYTIDELNALRKGMLTDSKKLLKIICQKAEEIGIERTKQLLSEICKRLPPCSTLTEGLQLQKHGDTMRMQRGYCNRHTFTHGYCAVELLIYSMSV
jgi:hypothetical protein